MVIVHPRQSSITRESHISEIDLEQKHDVSESKEASRKISAFELRKVCLANSRVPVVHCDPLPWRRYRSERLDGLVEPDGTDSTTVGLAHTWNLATNSSGSPSNSGVSCSVSARLSRSPSFLLIPIFCINAFEFPYFVNAQFVWNNYHLIIFNHHPCPLLN